MSFFEQHSNEFVSRHIGPNETDTQKMLETIGEPDLDTLINKTVPSAIRMAQPLDLPQALVA